MPSSPRAVDRDPSGSSAGPGGHARARAGADPARPDAGLAVHVLPGRGAADGRRPGRRRRPRGCGCSCAGTRTCRTSARSPRRSGGWSSTSTTSTRRCPARSSGTSSGWPRAWPWPGATTASPPRRRRKVVLAAVGGYRTAMRDVRRAAAAGRLVRPPRRRGRAGRASSRRSRPRRLQGRPRRCWPRRTPATACRRWRKLTTVGRRPAPDHQRPAADRAGRGALQRPARPTSIYEQLERAARASTGAPCSPTAGTCCEQFTLIQRGPQGRRRRQRRHPRLDPAAGGRRRHRAAVPAGQGGPGLGAGRLLRARASTTTRASGSSPGST